MKSKPWPKRSTPCCTVGTRRPRDFPCLRVAVANPGDRVGKCLRAELSWHAERNRKVEMTHPQTVDSRQRRDGVGVLNALRGLDLAEERAAPVGGDELVHNGPGAIAIVRDLQGDAAPSIGRVLHGFEDVASFVHVADHRQHEALGAHVHCTSDVMIFLRWNSYDHRQIGRLEIAYRALHRLETESGMLEIEEHEVASRRLENVPNSGRGELHDEMPELWGLGLSQLLQALRYHSSLPCAATQGACSLSSSTRATA